MRYKLIIFDLDGTILDTLEDLADSVNFALKSNNLPLRSLDQIRSFVGNGIKKLIERSVPDECSQETVEKVFCCFKEYYMVHSCDKTRPYDGITDLLIKLKNNGVKTAVISNKSDKAVKLLADKYFTGLFDFVFGEREGIAKKPSPDAVFEVMKYADADKSDTLYIGDSEVDILTSDNCGIRSIIVDWGFRDRDYLIQNGADLIVSAVEELEQVLMSE